MSEAEFNDAYKAAAKRLGLGVYGWRKLSYGKQQQKAKK